MQLGTADSSAEWPRKTRELHNHHFDSTIWNDFCFREDDIVIATYAKSGTTWLQQIVGQLLFQGAPSVAVSEISPWLDLRYPDKREKLKAVEAQKHRRFLKTHLPVDALVYSSRAKYLYVARDGRDVLWSLFNHHSKANDAWYEMLNDTPGLVGPPMPRISESVREYFHRWLDKDGYPFWPFWDNVRSWWAIRKLPNLLMLHYNDLKKDLAREIMRIAEFLGISIDHSRWASILLHCSFLYMKANGGQAVPLGGQMWRGGSDSFIHKGTNGRWREVLEEGEVGKYEAVARVELGAECASWLELGEEARLGDPLEDPNKALTSGGMEAGAGGGR